MSSCNCSSCNLIKQEEKGGCPAFKGARAKVKRSLLFNVLEHDDQRGKLKGCGNSRNHHGTLSKGSGKEGHRTCFDPVSKR
jgi:hypothetical protein